MKRGRGRFIGGLRLRVRFGVTAQRSTHGPRRTLCGAVSFARSWAPTRLFGTPLVTRSTARRRTAGELWPRRPRPPGVTAPFTVQVQRCEERFTLCDTAAAVAEMGGC